ncbi:COMM domain-containing protein 4-like [Tropilaelaps mercedesae]|uniref:COMM domain-containing protein 4-like n=1 Tax=Tropilaelaps mercedesae TaxID=418985 RepID=A0A1V9XW36_9ACAR|nr:COMM domain-containing protein 4-like [Tropilaelaps mercedesae]
MRFKFCGGLDCPDWLLAAFASLAKVSSIKVRSGAGQLARAMAEGRVDSETLAAAREKLTNSEDVAAVHEVLKLALRSQVEEAVLIDELQQLGLPREHSTGLGKAYAEFKARAVERLREDFVHQKGEISFRQKIVDGDRLIVVSAGDDDFVMGIGQARVLLEELKQALNAIDNCI